jgi:hypothetical protein
VLFSPGAASFEKFKNEFDRGKKFYELVGDTLITKKRLSRRSLWVFNTHK